ncbi:metallophosphoesterase [Bacillus sp. 03113]|uniref:metallophosphoesterase n=1 Tax=Bacillus sp. 03113 TaxID=2578211 RepID=UPI001142033D|nr:metallophosphoesterase [Bacillus sp. 03113]
MIRIRRKQLLACIATTSLVLLNFGTLFPKMGEASPKADVDDKLKSKVVEDYLDFSLTPQIIYPQSWTAINKLRTLADTTLGSMDAAQATITSVLPLDYIDASNGTNTTKTSEHTVTKSNPNVDFSKLPIFLVTEIVPDSTNTGGVDGYEFIEVYNNTDKSINFKDYKLMYRNGAQSTTDVIWPSVPDDLFIKSKDTLVFWIINDKNVEKTVADFNKNYGTSLVEKQNIVRVYNASMANTGMHGLVVADNTKKEISVSYYNDQEGVDDTQRNKGILFQISQNGSTISSKVSAGVENGTPGKVDAYQVPTQSVHMEEDLRKPTLENLTTQTEVKEAEDFKLTVDAQDDKAVKTVRVFYKVNDTSDYKSEILQQDYNTMFYHYTVYSPEIIGKDYIEYFFVVSDGQNETKSNTYKVKVTNVRNMESLRVNVIDNQILAGKAVITGTSNDESADMIELLIDDQRVATKTYKTFENTSYLAFEVSSVDMFFQNGVTMGNEVLKIFDEWILEWQTITVPIQPDRLKIGDNMFTIRSGNKATSFDLDSVENRDDYLLRNVRLVLGDGTIIKDSSFSSPTKIIAMKDSNPYKDFHFIISEEDAASKAYSWNTMTVTDGKHTITVKDSNEEVKIPVIVDNTAPTIDPSINKNKQYKGEFVIDPVITDAISGVDTIEVTLDGSKIATPYYTSSSQLNPGNHLLLIKAVDKAGNTKEEKFPFTVVDENPNKPVSVTSTGKINGTPKILVKVSDPTNDDMDVTFYQAFQYKPKNTNSITSYENTAIVEPPQIAVPEGEQPLTNAELSLISARDGKYLTTKSFDKFPYHRFDVILDRSVNEKDVVELVWKGKSLKGRKVTMYAWSHFENKWKVITHKIAGTRDFTLKGNVNVSEYMKDHKINVLIQDEIPASANDYAYTFVWMSDTQYYSKSYPYIYDAQTKWIAQNKDVLKIKYVFHTGDLVEESFIEDQWKNADQFMKTLENANVPYGVLAGNHDVDHKTSDYTQFYKYFGADRFSGKSYYGETYKNNRGHYDLISAHGNDYLMMYLGWGVDAEGIAWMNRVLAEHPDKKAILCFHEYLMASGTRHPNGEMIYKEVVLKNPNVIAVLSGHYHESQTIIDEIDDNLDGIPDRKVYQLLADYQAGPEGGQGYMRLLHIDQDNNRIIVNTYSPYLNDYNYFNMDVYPGKDEFIMDLNMQPMEKRVSTDSFEVNVYTNTEIGGKENVKSGMITEVKWKGLTENNSYSWYAVATDDFTGKTVSNIFTFTKGKPDKPVSRGNHRNL